MATAFEKKSNPPEPGYGPLLEQLISGALDGLYVPQENRHSLLEHPLYPRVDAELLNAPRGFLFFRKDRAALYGYKSLADFAIDCKAGKLEAKTAVGGLSLGPCRKVAGEVTEVTLLGTNLPAWPRFRAASMTEALEMEKLLKGWYPAGEVKFNRAGSLSALLPITPPVYSWRAWKYLALQSPPPMRRWFFWMITGMLLSWVLLLGGMLIQTYLWLAFLPMALFFVSWACFIRAINTHGPLRMDMLEKEKKPEDLPPEPLR